MPPMLDDSNLDALAAELRCPRCHREGLVVAGPCDFDEAAPANRQPAPPILPSYTVRCPACALVGENTGMVLAMG